MLKDLEIIIINYVNIEQLIEQYIDDLYGFAVRLCGNKHGAEDLLQDLFVNLSEKDIDSSYIKNPRSWLASILYRLFVDQWRHEKRSPLVFIHQAGKQADDEKAIDIEQAASNEPDPELMASLDEQQQKLMFALEQLKDKHKHLLIMHDMHGYTMKEIAIILDISQGTVKSRLHRAREALQKVLETMEPIALFRRSNQ